MEAQERAEWNSVEARLQPAGPAVFSAPGVQQSTESQDSSRRTGGAERPAGVGSGGGKSTSIAGGMTTTSVGAGATGQRCAGAGTAGVAARRRADEARAGSAVEARRGQAGRADRGEAGRGGCCGGVAGGEAGGAGPCNRGAPAWEALPGCMGPGGGVPGVPIAQFPANVEPRALGVE